MGIPDFWFHKFREGVKYQNHLIRRGEVDVEQILKPKKEIFIIDKDSNKLKSLKDQDFDDEPWISYTNHGTYHEFYISHEGVNRLLYSACSVSGFITLACGFTISGVSSFIVGAALGYLLIDYNLSDHENGITIVCFDAFTSFVCWGFYNEVDEENKEGEED